MITKKRDAFFLVSGLLLLAALLFLPALVKTVAIKRSLQVILMLGLFLLLVIALMVKARQEKINYWQLAVLTIYGITLYFLLRHLIH